MDNKAVTFGFLSAATMAVAQPAAAATALSVDSLGRPAVNGQSISEYFSAVGLQELAADGPNQCCHVVNCCTRPTLG